MDQKVHYFAAATELQMGRPRAFDEDAVLDSAMHLFWERGYEGTTLKDLLTVMGLRKSSLYKAFGSKDELFQRVLDRYESVHLGFGDIALAEKSPRAIVEKLLDGMVRLNAGETTPPGCLRTNAALACSPEAEPVRLQVVQIRHAFQETLSARFEQTSSVAPLPAGLDPDLAAGLVVTFVQGISVQAKSGLPLERLLALVRAFLIPWPHAADQVRTGG